MKNEVVFDESEVEPQCAIVAEMIAVAYSLWFASIVVSQKMTVTDYCAENGTRSESGSFRLCVRRALDDSL